MRLVTLLNVDAHGSNSHPSLHTRTLTTVSALALLAFVAGPRPGYAAESAQASPGQVAQGELEEVVITGSRIVRDGYEAPTPLSVVDAASLQSGGGTNIADQVNQMPVFANSSTPTSTTTSISAGTSGANALNLRGLGTGRTLVLLDGQRSVGAYLTGAVDVNSFPQQLVSRVEVVTGGASAVYGSDAVGGVANFILDRTYTGIKGEVSGGITSYLDDANWKVAIAAGQPFGGGRGHLLLSGEVVNRNGILNGSGGIGKRKWNSDGWAVMPAPGYSAVTGLNGRPEYITLNHVGQSNTTNEGLITSGPLKGLAFGPGGKPYVFHYGPINNGVYMQGGDWEAGTNREFIGSSLDPIAKSQNVFARVAYEVTDDFNIFAQWSWAHNNTETICCAQFSVNTLRVKSDNAFLLNVLSPAQRALLRPGEVYNFGTHNPDLPNDTGLNDRIIARYVIGGSGKFDAFDTGWSWDAYYQKGISRNDITAPTVYIRNRVQGIDATAVDAVFDARGNIVCRTTLTNPNDGCVPYNVFGSGVNSPAAVNYVMGASHLSQTLKQDVIGASVTGEPFSVPAGPVSVALTAEHRREKVNGVNDPLSQSSSYLSGNYRVTTGKFSVSEGAVETVVPIASGQAWADSWDLQLAARATDYSTAGYVTTWKAGTTYSPIPDIKFRITRSRDIRAPNLEELFAGGTSSSSQALDPFRICGASACSATPLGVTFGSQTLKPEKADTTGIGVVVQPVFLAGFSASVDFWDVKIKGSIAALSTQSTIDLCFKGQTDLCSRLQRDSQGVLVQVNRQPFNLALDNTRGLDFEASYRWSVEDMVDGWAGDLNLHGTATNYLKAFTDNGIDEPIDTAGSNVGAGPPSWLYSVQLSYALDAFQTGLTMRGISSGTYNNAYIECRTACPLSTINHRTIDSNHIDGQFWFDLSTSYKFEVGEASQVEAFLNIKNLLNSDPALVPPLATGSAFWAPLTNRSYYDVLGRVFRAGVRFKL